MSNLSLNTNELLLAPAKVDPRQEDLCISQYTEVLKPVSVATFDL